jgi:phosphonate transport system substrate-binding protein
MKKFLYLSGNYFAKQHLFNKSIIIFLAMATMLLNTGCIQKVSQSYPVAVDKTPNNLLPLKIGILPTQNAKDQRQMIQRFDDYLEKALQRTIDVQLASNYTEAVDWLVEEKVDIAYLGPLTYLEALERGAKIEPLVAPIDKDTGQPWYRSCIIIKSDSPIKTLSDLKGKRVAFVDKSSTSGYLMPLAAFNKLNIDPEQDFSKLIYTGNHNKSMEALENGIVDAAATNIPSYLKQQKKGKLTSENSRILWESTPLPQSPVVVLKKLPPELIKQLKQAFINTPDGIEDITATESAGYTLVSPSDYEPIQQLRKDLKLISIPSK